MSRQPAANALWGQLLRKTTLAPSAPDAQMLLPTAPLDKTGTSMRILLHDTQANFDKFSVKVDALSTEIEDAKRQIVVTKDLFHVAQESLTSDIVDIVNRCQTQIQKTVGEPTQATTLELLRNDVDARLDGLSKRIDDMHSFNQTQAQALQNVTVMLQSVQESQGKILTALLPLQPLLQAVPVHINSARSSINEAMLKMSLESTRVHRTPPQSWPQQRSEMSRKRSLPGGPPSSPLSVRKRPRLEQQQNDPESTASPDSATRRLSDSFHNPGHPLAPANRAQSLTNSFRELGAPRRPLGDLPVPPQHSTLKNLPFSLTTKELLPSTRSPVLPVSLLRALPRTTGVPKSPPLLTKEKHSPTPQRHTPALVQTTSPPSSAPLADPMPGVPALSVPDITPVEQKQALATPSSSDHTIAKTTTRTAPSKASPSSAPVALNVAMVRGRRSPFRNGRRFIPLDDDDDSSSEKE